MPDRPRHEPQVFDYLDYRTYLKDWFAWKKDLRPKYSYAVFARHAGFSRGVMNNIIAGRRAPGADTLEGIGKALGIDSEGVAFLALLVESNHASTLEERAGALRKVFDHPRFSLSAELDPNLVQLMAVWYGAVILELVRLPGFSEDPEWLAERLGGRLTPAEAAEAFELCLRSGVLTRRPDGSLTVDVLRIGREIHARHDAVRLWHLDMLDLAREATVSLPQDERLALSVLGSMSRSMVPAMQGHLVRMMREATDLMDQSARSEVEDGEVYVMSTYLFPVTGVTPQAPEEPED